MPRQTTFAKNGDIPRRWRHIDADGQVLGRMAVRIATVLMGKHRPDYTPHVDTGDFVVVTNADRVVVTGRKPEQRILMRYSGYPGGLKTRTLGQELENFPERVIESAVRRMLPKTRLGRAMIKKLKVYRGSEHPHGSNCLEPLDA
ncbi:MAG: 50S ribosomal protein L13 [Planctomycetota bacterium]|nr:50S ribosomal protein L13 [Planctomycetota bacterium]